MFTFSDAHFCEFHTCTTILTKVRITVFSHLALEFSVDLTCESVPIRYYGCDLEQDWQVDTKFSREIRCKLILHVNEYPTSTMHYLGNPRHTLSMIAHDLYWLD